MNEKKKHSQDFRENLDLTFKISSLDISDTQRHIHRKKTFLISNNIPILVEQFFQLIFSLFRFQ